MPISAKEQLAKDNLKKFSDNHPLRKEQIRIKALEEITEAAIIWNAGGYSDNDLHSVIIDNLEYVN